MPKPTRLSELFALLAREDLPQTSPIHYLFLLGTDTVFTPRPTVPEKSYERGETLSYIAETVTILLGENEAAVVGEANAPWSFSSPSVDVLNGPNTRGSNVGERIADALFLALSAIASGKKVLQLSAHSRGAVEATLLMHELERIKRALRETPNQSLEQILLESPCKHTSAALAARLQGVFGEGETPELRARLLQLLEALEINAFLIDPVPGDTLYGIPGISWDDPRFYIKPPCKQSEWLLCEDERSNCFFPIVPEDTKFELLPGHHGTLSGNRYSQQLSPIPTTTDYQDLTTISAQDLVLCKWFYFAHRTTKAFPTPESPFALEQHRSSLDIVLNQFLNADLNGRKSQLLKHYQQVAKDVPAYRYFRNTSYPVIGRSAGDRPVHFRKRQLKGLSSIAPTMPTGFINEFHAELFLDEYGHFSRNLTADADVQLATIDCSLINMINEMRQGQGKLLDLMLNEQGESQFFNGLAILVDAMGQKYLRNHLAADEKKRLMDGIHVPFRRLAEVKNEQDFPFEQHINRFEEVLQTGIKRTLETHHERILHQWNMLFEQAKYFLADSSIFSQVFNTYLMEIQLEEGVLASALQSIKDRLQSIRPITVESVKDALMHELELIQGKETLGAAQKDRLQNTLLGEHYQRLRCYVEAHETPIEQYFMMFEELYQGAEDLLQAYPQLKPLLGEKSLEIDLRQLQLCKRESLARLGHMLKEKAYDLSKRPEAVSEPYYYLARDAAVLQGAVLPEVLELRAEVMVDEALLSQLGLRDIEKAQTIARMDEEKAQLEKEKENIRQFANQLFTRKESRTACLIQTELMPKTYRYLIHLKNEAKNPRGSNEDEKAAYLAKLKQKYEKVQALYGILSDTDELPSQSIAKFTKMLSEHDKTLKQNRNDGWTSYVKSCLALVALVVTGILPGVAYALVTGRSPLFFAERRTTGAAYVADIQNDLSRAKCSA